MVVFLSSREKEGTVSRWIVLAVIVAIFYRSRGYRIEEDFTAVILTAVWIDFLDRRQN